jgi:hypothetical protein
MRRAGATLAIALACVACSPRAAPEGYGTPLSLRGAATDVTAVQTVGRFLDAYAAAPTDGALALTELAGSPVVGHWAAWLGVQYAQIGGVSGSVDLRSIGAARPAEGTSGIDGLVAVPIEASVTFSIPTSTGGHEEQVRVLDGPVLLVPDPEGSWRVADFVRDGVPLSSRVFVFDPQSRFSRVSERGVTITVDSFIQDASEWAVGVLIRNDRDREIRITDGTVGLVDATGSIVMGGSTPDDAEVIEPGTTQEALVAFQVPAEEELVGLRFFVGAVVDPTDRPVFVVVPVQPILRSLRAAGAPPPPSPNPGGTA